MKRLIVVFLVVLILGFLDNDRVVAQTSPYVSVNRIWVFPISPDMLKKLDESGFLPPFFQPRSATSFYAVVIRFSVPESDSRKWYDNVMVALELHEEDSGNIEIIAWLPQTVDEPMNVTKSWELAAESVGAIQQLAKGRFRIGTESTYVRLYRRVWVNQSSDGNRVVWTFRPADDNPWIPGDDNPILPGMYYVTIIVEVPQDAKAAVAALGCCAIGEFDPNPLNFFELTKQCAASQQQHTVVPLDAAMPPESIPIMETCDLESCGERLAYDDVASDAIASAGRKCRFSFSGQEGDLVSIRMIRQDESLDPFVELRDADGNILASDNDSAGNSNSEIGGYQLPGSGIYTIVTQSYNNATTGAFEFSLTESPQARACGDEIAYGETGYGEIAETSDSCVYGFSGQEGDLVSIRMIRQDESLDPFVELRDADGNILASDDDSAGNSNSEIGGYQLPGSGIYTIVTQSYNNANDRCV